MGPEALPPLAYLQKVKSTMSRMYNCEGPLYNFIKRAKKKGRTMEELITYLGVPSASYVRYWLKKLGKKKVKTPGRGARNGVYVAK